MREELIKLKYENKKLKEIVSALRHELSLEKNKVKMLEQKYEKYVAEEEIRFEKALDKAVAKVKKEYEGIIEELKNKIAKYESQSNTNSTNSSLPSSKNKIGTKIANNREKSNNKIGAQEGHKIHKLEYFKEEEITEIKEHKLEVCPECKGELVEENIVKSDIIDFNIKITKIRNNIHNYKCSCCGKKVSANEELPRAVSYGDNINATALDLMNTSNVAINKVAKHIRGITNQEINMSEGYLAKLQKKSANKLDTFIEELKEQIIKLQVVHWDDTTCKINNKDSYIRFYGNDSLALLIAHESKNKEGIDKDNILSRLSEKVTVVHDHVLLNYNKEYAFKNAECNAHITRYLKGVKDNIHDHLWQDKLRELLIKANEDKKQLIEKNKDSETIAFSDAYLNNISKEYDECIKLGYEENNKLEDYHFYKDEEIKLLKRLEKYKENHLLYLYDIKVPFSNNTAEQGLRKVKRKLCVSFSFKNFDTQDNYAKILSYLETCERNGISKFDASLRLVSGNPYSIHEILEIAKNA